MCTALSLPGPWAPVHRHTRPLGIVICTHVASQHCGAVTRYCRGLALCRADTLRCKGEVLTTQPLLTCGFSTYYPSLVASPGSPTQKRGLPLLLGVLPGPWCFSQLAFPLLTSPGCLGGRPLTCTKSLGRGLVRPWGHALWFMPYPPTASPSPPNGVSVASQAGMLGCDKLAGHWMQWYKCYVCSCLCFLEVSGAQSLGEALAASRAWVCALCEQTSVLRARRCGAWRTA